MKAKSVKMSCISLLMLFMAGVSCWGAVYNISSASELASIDGTAGGGDEIILADGTYHNTTFTFDGDGSPGNLLVLRAQTPGKVVLTGTSTIRLEGQYLMITGFVIRNPASSSDIINFRTSSSSSDHAYNSVLSNCAIYGPSGTAVGNKWVSLHGTHNTVTHCYFEGKNNEGTLLVVWRPDSSAQYHRIENNYFGYRPDGGGNGYETIRIGTSDESLSDSYCIIERNLFEDCDGEGEIISSKSGRNIYRYNTFRHCAGTLTLRHGDNCLVEGNFFFGEGKSGSGGVRVIGENHIVINNYFEDLLGDDIRAALCMMNGIVDSELYEYFQVKNSVVAFNTFVNNYETFCIGYDGKAGTLPPLDCTIANNIVIGGSSAIFRSVDVYDPINMFYEGNIMIGSLGLSPQPAGITIANPNLMPASPVWRLASDNPATNSAAGVYTYVSNDMDGQPRNDGFKDIGADEVTGSTAANFPLTISNVGISWLEISPPLTPIVFYVLDTTPTTITLAWEDRGTNVDSYTVYMTTSETSYGSPAATVLPGVQTVTLENLRYDTVYYFKLVANNQYGTSSYVETSAQTLRGNLGILKVVPSKAQAGATVVLEGIPQDSEEVHVCNVNGERMAWWNEFQQYTDGGTIYMRLSWDLTDSDFYYVYPGTYWFKIIQPGGSDLSVPMAVIE